MLLEVEERSVVLLVWVIDITKEVKQVGVRLLNELNLGIGVPSSVNVELSGILLEGVSLGGLGTKGDNLLDSPLSICSGQVVHLEQELEHFGELVLWLGQQVLKSAEMNWVLPKLRAVFN